MRLSENPEELVEKHYKICPDDRTKLLQPLLDFAKSIEEEVEKEYQEKLAHYISLLELADGDTSRIVVLDENQGLPPIGCENTNGYCEGDGNCYEECQHKDSRLKRLAQQDMLDDHWVRIIPEGK